MSQESWAAADIDTPQRLPEEHLLMAVFQRAVVDYLSGVTPGDGGCVRVSAEEWARAEEYLFGAGDGLYSARKVAEHFGFSLSRVRKRLLYLNGASPEERLKAAREISGARRPGVYERRAA